MTVKQLRGRVWVIAHRGASHDAPEHTVAAYDLAVLRDHADFLECDLQVTSDGALVCMHDATVDRTSDGAGEVAGMTLEDLRNLDLGTWFNRAHPERADAGHEGQRVVTLEEQIARYWPLDPELRFHIETKTGAGKGKVEAALVDILELHQMLDPDPASAHAVVQSFHPESLSIINGLTGDGVPTALLTLGPGPEHPPPGVDIVAPDHRALLATPAYVARMHDLGIEVHTWTVDDPAVMSTLIEAGVDGIFTNRPDVLRRLLSERFGNLVGQRGVA